MARIAGVCTAQAGCRSAHYITSSLGLWLGHRPAVQVNRLIGGAGTGCRHRHSTRSAAGCHSAHRITSSSGLRLGHRPAASMSLVIRHRVRAGEQQFRSTGSAVVPAWVAGIGTAPGQQQVAGPPTASRPARACSSATGQRSRSSERVNSGPGQQAERWHRHQHCVRPRSARAHCPPRHDDSPATVSPVIRHHVRTGEQPTGSAMASARRLVNSRLPLCPLHHVQLVP